MPSAHDGPASSTIRNLSRHGSARTLPIDRVAGLRTLVASGLAEQDYAVMPAGRVALEDREPKWMRIAWPHAAIVVAIYVASTVIDWFS